MNGYYGLLGGQFGPGLLGGMPDWNQQGFGQPQMGGSPLLSMATGSPAAPTPPQASTMTPSGSMKVPFKDNPAVTALGAGLLNYGLTGRADFSGMPQAVAAKNIMAEKMAERQAAEARRAKMVDIIKNWSGLSPDERAYYYANPDKFTPPTPAETWETLPADTAAAMGYPLGAQRNTATGEVKIPGGRGTNISLNTMNPATEGADPGYMWATKKNPVTGQMEYDLNEQGQPYQILKPGGKIEADKTADEERKTAGTLDTLEKADSMTWAVNDIKRIAEESSGPITGTWSRLTNWETGSPAGQVAANVATLKSGTVLGAMKKLKELSATGATGFGAMNGSELQVLIDDIGALDPVNTDERIFMATIDRIGKRWDRVLADIKKNVPREKLREYGFEELVYPQGTDDGFEDIGNGVKIREVR